MGNSCSFSTLSDEALSYMPLEAQMEHGNLAIAYFPGHISDPVITDTIATVCSHSWKQLLAGESNLLRERKEADQNFSPITAFYDVFYKHLFEKAPNTRQFFAHGGIQKRAQSLIQMISTGLNMIGKDEAKIKKNLSFIAYSHGKMGIGPKDYSPVVTALFFTLKELLGEGWNNETKQAWTVAYSYIVNIMVPIAADSVREYNKKKEQENKHEDSFHFNDEENEGGGGSSWQAEEDPHSGNTAEQDGDPQFARNEGDHIPVYNPVHEDGTLTPQVPPTPSMNHPAIHNPNGQCPMASHIMPPPSPRLFQATGSSAKPSPRNSTDQPPPLPSAGPSSARLLNLPSTASSSTNNHPQLTIAVPGASIPGTPTQ